MRLQIFNIVVVCFRNIDKKLIVNVIKHPEAKMLYQKVV